MCSDSYNYEEQRKKEKEEEDKRRDKIKEDRRRFEEKRDKEYEERRKLEQEKREKEREEEDVWRAQLVKRREFEEKREKEYKEQRRLEVESRAKLEEERRKCEEKSAREYEQRKKLEREERRKAKELREAESEERRRKIDEMQHQQFQELLWREYEWALREHRYSSSESEEDDDDYLLEEYTLNAVGHHGERTVENGIPATSDVEIIEKKNCEIIENIISAKPNVENIVNIDPVNIDIDCEEYGIDIEKTLLENPSKNKDVKTMPNNGQHFSDCTEKSISDRKINIERICDDEVKGSESDSDSGRLQNKSKVDSDRAQYSESLQNGSKINFDGNQLQGNTTMYPDHEPSHLLTNSEDNDYNQSYHQRNKSVFVPYHVRLADVDDKIPSKESVKYKDDKFLYNEIIYSNESDKHPSQNKVNNNFDKSWCNWQRNYPSNEITFPNVRFDQNKRFHHVRNFDDEAWGYINRSKSPSVKHYQHDEDAENKHYSYDRYYEDHCYYKNVSYVEKYSNHDVNYNDSLNQIKSKIKIVPNYDEEHDQHLNATANFHCRHEMKSNQRRDKMVETDGDKSRDHAEDIGRGDKSKYSSSRYYENRHYIYKSDTDGVNNFPCDQNYEDNWYDSKNDWRWDNDVEDRRHRCKFKSADENDDSRNENKYHSQDYWKRPCNSKFDSSRYSSDANRKQSLSELTFDDQYYKSFMVTFKNLAENNYWTEDAMLDELVSRLKYAALDYYMILPYSVKNNYCLLVEKLQDKFDKRHSEAMLRKKLSMTSQLVGQDIKQCIEHVRSLAGLAYPYVMDTPEEVTTDALLCGCGNINAVLVLESHKQPNSFASAVDLLETVIQNDPAIQGEPVTSISMIKSPQPSPEINISDEMSRFKMLVIETRNGSTDKIRNQLDNSQNRRDLCAVSSVENVNRSLYQCHESENVQFMGKRQMKSYMQPMYGYNSQIQSGVLNPLNLFRPSTAPVYIGYSLQRRKYNECSNGLHNAYNGQLRLHQGNPAYFPLTNPTKTPPSSQENHQVKSLVVVFNSNMLNCLGSGLKTDTQPEELA